MREVFTSDVPYVLDKVESERSTRVSPAFEAFIASRNECTRPPKNPNKARQLFVDTNAKDFIDSNAIYNEDLSLNIDETARHMKIPVKYTRTTTEMGAIYGVKEFNEEIRIELNAANSTQAVTFGHEIGHFFYSKVFERKNGGKAEEDFCDYFGMAMAMPANISNLVTRADLMNEQTLLDYMLRFDMTLDEIILQFMEYDILPPKVAIDTYYESDTLSYWAEKVNRLFVCRHCHDTHGDWFCPNANTNVPLYDFTDRAWAGIIPIAGCGKGNFNEAVYSNLTEQYQNKLGQLALFSPITGT